VTPHEARVVLTAFAHGRDEWLTRTTTTLDAAGLWLIGSLATASADDWSDLDLIVVNGAPALEGALLTIDMPANGPAGGGYLGAMYDVAGLPLWVDWYLWPAHAALPAEARQLAGLGITGGHEVSRSGTRGELDLSGTLDHLGRGRPGAPPDPTDFALAMLPLAAKHLARGNHDTAISIATMLGAQIEHDLGAALSDVLSDLEESHRAAALVRRHLSLVNAFRTTK